MNKTILNLEKRKNRVLKMRNEYMWNCDKETEPFESNLMRYDSVLDRIVRAIKIEWNKYYKNEKKIAKSF
jgi:hypothetical protein